mmetsp:Transcript_131233/g.238685  ORF Transcript_131233/g.238685 Transcript_131233/m.238685 type:complete len:264 (+) Transcript_131233:1422-2213(+)
MMPPSRLLDASELPGRPFLVFTSLVQRRSKREPARRSGPMPASDGNCCSALKRMVLYALISAVPSRNMNSFRTRCVPGFAEVPAARNPHCPPAGTGASTRGRFHSLCAAVASWSVGSFLTMDFAAPASPLASRRGHFRGRCCAAGRSALLAVTFAAAAGGAAAGGGAVEADAGTRLPLPVSSSSSESSRETVATTLACEFCCALRPRKFAGAPPAKLRAGGGVSKTMLTAAARSPPERRSADANKSSLGPGPTTSRSSASCAS